MSDARAFDDVCHGYLFGLPSSDDQRLRTMAKCWALRPGAITKSHKPASQLPSTDLEAPFTQLFVRNRPQCVTPTQTTMSEPAPTDEPTQSQASSGETATPDEEAKPKPSQDECNAKGATGEYLNAASLDSAEVATNETENSNSDDKRKQSSDESKTETNPPRAAKKAKIAMPPAVSSLQLNVDKYTLDSPPSSDANQDASTKIETPALMVFGLHPLVKEEPLKKLCEEYGSPIQSFGVRSAFASRYCHLEYTSVDQAQAAYAALNGAKLFQKALLVQPAPAPKS